MEGSLVQSGPVPYRARERALVWELAKREVAGRYRGASLGVAWSLLQPFLMLAVYTLAFGQILKARWPGADDIGGFAVILFVGIIVHAFFAECMSKAPTLVAANSSYVKRILFPLEVLPWPTLLSALFHLATSSVVLMVFLLLMDRPLHATALLLPVVVAPLAVLSLGCMWLLAAVAVYVRDVGQLIGPIVTAMFFLSSAVVPIDSVPQAFRFVFEWNPLTPIIDETRAVVLYGQWPDAGSLAVSALFAFAVFFAGFAVFRRLRSGFADVL
jgi:lipopolysaccharide transport system permease protein